MMGKLPQTVEIVISNTIEMNNIFLSNKSKCSLIFHGVFNSNELANFFVSLSIKFQYI